MTEEYPLSNLSGGCRCGKYKFRVSAKPFLTSYCHCSDCRKATGAPVTVFVGFNEAEIQLGGKDALTYQSTPTVQRLFCGNCGTPIGYRDNRLPGEIYYYLGIMNKPENFCPTLHAWTAEQLAWLKINDDLPHFKAFSRQR